MKLLVALALISVGILPSAAFAASTFFGVDASTIPPGSPVQIGVFVNTEGEAMNAVSGDVVLPIGAENVSILSSGSLISLWVVPPTLSGDKIHFEGVIPGGLTSSQLPLFSILLTPSAAGNFSVSTSNVHVYKNDGLGTELPVKDGVVTLLIKEGAAPAVAPAKDVTPPEPFTPALINDPSIASGKTAVIFAATDTESGVDHYDVREVGWIFSSPWVKAVSPYVLPASIWPERAVEVRAVDRSGNVRLASVSVPLNLLSLLPFLGCILLLGIIALLFLKKYRGGIWRKHGSTRFR